MNTTLRITATLGLALALVLGGCDDDTPTSVVELDGVVEDVQVDLPPTDTDLREQDVDAVSEVADDVADSEVSTDGPGDGDASSDQVPDVVSVCGNRLVEAGEACDDGNQAADDGCNATCTAIEDGFACPVPGSLCEECGNGVHNPPEECDDGARVLGDGCDATCHLEPGFSCPIPNAPCEECGDGAVDPHEACDDGNRVSADGCAANCLQLELGYVCPTPGLSCVAERCGDSIVAGGEGCDDGNRLSGDGCSFLCAREPGFVCNQGGVPCVAAVCGNGIVEAQEQCDDFNLIDTDGCDAGCRLQPGFACPNEGVACVAIACGDGSVDGLEQCDDGNLIADDGCTDTCEISPGYQCPIANTACSAAEFGNGLIEGLEACDDDNLLPDDGCSPTCVVEPLYACSGEPSLCALVIEFVSIARFPAPTPQTQSVHYDPVTRSFVVYGFNSGDGTEFCLDGSVVGTRPRYVTDRLDGATYDPFTDRFLFIQQDNTLTEVDRGGNIVRQEVLSGVNFAGGIAVGDNGRLYLSGQADHLIHVFERFGTSPIASIASGTGQTWFDQMIAIAGMGMIGAHFLPAGASTYQLSLYDLEGVLIGRSEIPGKLFRNGVNDFVGNSDGAEAAVDGGAFMICSEYDGFCELFARTCASDAECAARLPQTACKLDEPIPYCYSPAAARDDRYTVASGPQVHNLDVGRNDLSSEAACTSNSPTLLAVSVGDQGGVIAIAADGVTIDYTPAAGFCDGKETFTYDTDLGGQTETATVEVLVTCTCGDGFVGGTEECDDGDLQGSDGCDGTCRVETGWLCDNSTNSSICQQIN